MGLSLTSKPWVEYVNSTSESSWSEKRVYQVMLADFLLGDLVNGDTTRQRFLMDLRDFLEVQEPISHFEAVVRNYAGLEDFRVSFLKELTKAEEMGGSPSLFEVLARVSIKLKLPSRKGKVPRPRWLKQFVRILAEDTTTAENIVSDATVRLVKRKLNSIGAQPIERSDHVIRKFLKETVTI
jgi:hypothetical protein